MFIRRLLNTGIDEFRRQLSEIREGRLHDLQKSFLTDDQKSSEFNFNIEIEMRAFTNKHAITKYLVEKLDLINNRALYYDVGLWSWLSVFYFDLICPKNSEGQHPVRADARYILADPKNWTRYYRHLLACPARLYCDLGELAEPFLAAEIHIWGDFHEQLTAYQDIATNRALISSAKTLYWDSTTGKLKKGAGSKGPGSPRRFSGIVGQFELTYDLNAMDARQIVQLFPKQEFRKWLAT